MNNWISTKDFYNLPAVNLLFKEKDRLKPNLTSPKNYYTLFRKEIDVVKKAKKYTVKISADDYYKLYINGEYVGQGPASAYHNHYFYNVYDITDLINEGSNSICVHCYYQGLINQAYYSGDQRQGMWMELAEGGKIILKSNEEWKYHIDESSYSNDITWGYDTQFVENIDRRKHPIGWTKAGFDDSNWNSALIRKNDDHILTEQPTPVVERYEIFPVSIREFSSKNFLLDFGTEIVGTVRLKCNTNGGETVKIMCAEELTQNGHARFDMRCNIKFQEKWTLAQGEDVIENYEYIGFRYLEVETDSAEILPKHFSVMPQHYPVKNRLKLNSGNNLINDIWDICENAVIIGSQEGFYDCPTREKAQYLGDLLITALAHYYLTGDNRLYKKALFDFEKTQVICEGMLAVSPGALMSEIADYSLLYPLVLYNYYKATNDKETVKELLPAAEKAISYFSKYKREDGLIEKVTDKWNLVDWPENLRDNYEFPLTSPIGEGVHNVINAYYYGAMKTVNTLRSIVGKEAMFETECFKNAFIKVFYNEKTQLFLDMENGTHSALHSNVLPYFYDMIQDSNRIEGFIMEKGLSCGVYFAYFVLTSLAEHGKKELALELMLNKSEKSWYNMLQEGATTCFEAWGKDQKWNTSLCHPWAATPIILITEYFYKEFCADIIYGSEK